MNFWRKDLSLSERWWHRLAKVLLLTTTVCVAVFASIMLYAFEEPRATRYQVSKSLGDYYNEAKHNMGAEIDLTAGFVPGPAGPVEGLSRPFDGQLLVFESFLSDKSLKGSLGCRKAEGSVEWLYTEEAKEAIDCRVSKEAALCYVPDSICGGKASAIVRYNTYVDYRFGNYSRITGEVLLLTSIWIVGLMTIYYGGLLYIIFGSSKNIS